MKFKLTFFLITAIMGMGHAQQNFRPATIKSVSGEIQTGFIDYKNWSENPESVTVKIGGKEQELGLNELAYFEVKRADNVPERYQKAIVQLDMSPSKFEDLGTLAQPVFVTDTLFLMVLVEGRTSLYYYNDIGKAGKHYFIGAENGEITELVQKDYRVNDGTIVASNNRYRLQLANLGNECTSGALPNATKLLFVDAPLMKYVAKLNECTGNAPAYQWKREKTKLSAYILVGANRSRMINFTMLSSAFLGKSDNYKWDTGPMLGVGVNLPLPRTNGKFIIANEMIYNSMKPTHVYVSQNSTTKTVRTVEFNLNYLRLSSSLLWNMYKGKISPYLRFGITNSILINHDIYSTNVRTDVVTGNFVDTYKYKFLNEGEIRKYEFGLQTGLGVYLAKRKLSLEFSTYLTNGFSKVIRYNTTVQSLNLIAAYHF